MLGTYLTVSGAEEYLKIERDIPSGGDSIYLIRWPRCADRYAAELLATKTVETIRIEMRRRDARNARILMERNGTD